jgi:hypothetical protein
MRPILRVLAAVAICAPLVASTAGPAVACECARLDPHRIVRQADAIVAGRVVNVVTVDPTHTMSSLAVEGVYEGRVGSTLTMRSDIGPGGGSDCAVFYPVGSKVDPLVLNRLPDDTYVVDICAMPMTAQIAKLLGAARPPPANGPPAAPIPTVVAAVPPPANVPPSANRVSWPAVGGGALVALALIVLAVRRSARSTEAEPHGPDAAAAVPGEDGAPPVEPSG